jgi:predicted hotdog family 3-hydroxylacyl-ACP dehydratase
MPLILDHTGVAARVPHHGTMCLLDRLLGWSDDSVSCTAVSHRDPGNPLRSTSGLLAAHAIEYAAQAMALHGALRAEAGGTAAGPVPGYLASARGVKFARWRLDDVPGALRIDAERIAGDVRQLLYGFRVTDAAGNCLAEGRATVVLNTPLRPAGTTP